MGKRLDNDRIMTNRELFKKLFKYLKPFIKHFIIALILIFCVANFVWWNWGYKYSAFVMVSPRHIIRFFWL